MNNHSTKKLVLSMETLRNLNPDVLDNVNGGVPNTSTPTITLTTATPPVIQITQTLSNPCGRIGAAIDLTKKVVTNNHARPGHFGTGK